MANVIINVEALECFAPELLYISNGVTNFPVDNVTFQAQWESHGDYYFQNVDPNTKLELMYDYQNGDGWYTYQDLIPFTSLTDFPITIDKKYGYTHPFFKLRLIVPNSQCGNMESNVLNPMYT